MAARITDYTLQLKPLGEDSASAPVSPHESITQEEMSNYRLSMYYYPHPSYNCGYPGFPYSPHVTPSYVPQGSDPVLSDSGIVFPSHGSSFSSDNFNYEQRLSVPDTYHGNEDEMYEMKEDYATKGYHYDSSPSKQKPECGGKHEKKKPAKVQKDKKKCSNCLATQSPSWRRSTAKETQNDLLCNACGLYEKTAKRSRMLVTNDEGSTKVVRKRDAREYRCVVCKRKDASRWRRVDDVLKCEKCTRYGH